MPSRRVHVDRPRHACAALHAALSIEGDIARSCIAHEDAQRSAARRRLVQSSAADPATRLADRPRPSRLVRTSCRAGSMRT